MAKDILKHFEKFQTNDREVLIDKELATLNLKKFIFDHNYNFNGKKQGALFKFITS